MNGWLNLIIEQTHCYAKKPWNSIYCHWFRCPLQFMVTWKQINVDLVLVCAFQSVNAHECRANQTISYWITWVWNVKEFSDYHILKGQSQSHSMIIIITKNMLHFTNNNKKCQRSLELIRFYYFRWRNTIICFIARLKLQNHHQSE